MLCSAVAAVALWLPLLLVLMLQPAGGAGAHATPVRGGEIMLLRWRAKAGCRTADTMRQVCSAGNMRFCDLPTDDCMQTRVTG
jgi:hypothetical protein